jgi:hypothetical protein
VEIFNVDWDAHMGKDLGDLGQWKKFCRLCSIDPGPIRKSQPPQDHPDVLIESMDDLAFL